MSNHPCYQGRHSLFRSNRSRAERLLALGPWFWPSRADDGACTVACEVMGTEEPPPISPGEIPLVAYQNKRGSLWKLSPILKAGDDRVYEFMSDARESWQQSLSAVPRSIPFLWKGLAPSQRRVLRAKFAAGGAKAAALGDQSFGLAFGLAIVSEILELAMPSDLIASATIDEYGRLGPVGGLAQKITTVADFAPRVERFFVFQAQVEKARELAAGRLDIIGVASLSEAIEEVFGDDLSKLVDAVETEADRREFIGEIFRLGVGRRDSVMSWRPVAEAAKRARQNWSDLPDNERRKLDFVIAIASRHDANKGGLEIPPREWLQQFSQPLRTGIIAHLVQQATDTGRPEPRAALAYAMPSLVRGPDAFPVQLKLLGALGRLQYLLGEHHRALEYQMEAVEGWLERRRYDEVSYPLSFAYHVAGAIGDEQAFAELKSQEGRWQVLGSVSKVDMAYVMLAKAHASFLFGQVDESESLLRNALDIPNMPKTFRQVVCRRLTRLWEEDGRDEEVATLARQQEELGLHWLDANLSGEVSGHYVQQRLLLEMGRAVQNKERDRALNLLSRLVELQPHPFTNMLKYAGIDEEEKAEFIMRYYFY